MLISAPMGVAKKAQMKLDFRRRRKDGRVARKPGRKASGFRRDVPHRKRAEVNARHPVHVTLRVADEVAELRTRKAYQAIRRALRTCARREDYRVVHISIQDNHVHAIVEANDRRALARGMQGFTISAAKWINRALGRKCGTVFACRYHATAITTPTQARNEIAYVINNWLKHGADGPWRIDPFSSAWQFDGWATAHGYAAPREPLPVVEARSWLLREGWRRGGPLIALDEVPSARRGGS
jgi:putative transposase